jgi:hypothetical protein
MLSVSKVRAGPVFTGANSGLFALLVGLVLLVTPSQAAFAQTGVEPSSEVVDASEVRAALLTAQAELAQNMVRLNTIIAYQLGLLAGIESDGALLGTRPDPGAVCGEGAAGICAYFRVTFAKKDL